MPNNCLPNQVNTLCQKVKAVDAHITDNSNRINELDNALEQVTDLVENIIDTCCSGAGPPIYTQTSGYAILNKFIICI